MPQVWVLKRELLWLPFFGWALALARPVAVDRRNGRSAAMKNLLAQGKSRLDDGISIIVFPEGAHRPGERGTYVGGALLATHTGYPVLPIAHNAGTLWPKNGFPKKYPGRVQITIGAPIAVAGAAPRRCSPRPNAGSRPRSRRCRQRSTADRGVPATSAGLQGSLVGVRELEGVVKQSCPSGRPCCAKTLAAQRTIAGGPLV